MIVTVVTTVLVVVVIGVLGTRLAAIAPPTEDSLQPTVVALATLSAPAVAASPAATTAATPVPGATPTSTPPMPMSVVDAGGARAMLRAEPGTDARIVERLTAGSQVTELGAETTVGRGTWRRVRSGSGAEGWVDSSLLRRVGAASQPRR